MLDKISLFFLEIWGKLSERWTFPPWCPVVTTTFQKSRLLKHICMFLWLFFFFIEFKMLYCKFSYSFYTATLMYLTVKESYFPNDSARFTSRWAAVSWHGDHLSSETGNPLFSCGNTVWMMYFLFISWPTTTTVNTMNNLDQCQLVCATHSFTFNFSPFFIQQLGGKIIACFLSLWWKQMWI